MLGGIGTAATQQIQQVDVAKQAQYGAALESNQQLNTYAAYEQNQNEIEVILRDAHRDLAFLNIGLSWRIHDATNNFIVSVVNRETGDLIREVPQESSLDFLAHIREMKGIFMSARV